MGRTRLGFDMGSRSVKIAVRREDGLQVEQIRLPEELADRSGPGWSAALSRFLRQTRRELGLPWWAPAALSLPPTLARCRLVTLPLAEDALGGLPPELAALLPGPPEQYLFSYRECIPQPGDVSPEGSRPVMGAAAARRTLADYKRIFLRAGIRLETILPQWMALIQLTEGREEALCVVDLGHHRTRVAVVRRDRLRAARRITLGGRHLDRVVADELGVGLFQANTYKHTNHQDVLSARPVAELCRRIAAEVGKTVRLYQSANPARALEGLYLVGGGADLPPLRQAIAAATGLELLRPENLLPGAGPAAAGIFAAGAAMGGR